MPTSPEGFKPTENREVELGKKPAHTVLLDGLQTNVGLTTEKMSDAMGIRAISSAVHELCETLQKISIPRDDIPSVLDKIKRIHSQPHFMGRDIYGLSIDRELTHTLEVLEEYLSAK